MAWLLFALEGMEGVDEMSNKRSFKAELSGWSETLYYTITTPADTKKDAVVETTAKPML